MTQPAQQPEFKEYILVLTFKVHPEMREKSLRDYIHSQIFTDDWIGAFRTNYIMATEFQIRSRLAPSPQTKCIVCVLTPGSCLSQHDTTIRNATLDELHSWGYYRYRNSLVKTNGINEYTAWSEHIESLRTKEQAP